MKSNVTVETVSINAIKPYWRNAKTGANVDLLAKSISEYGYTSFIVVDKNYTIVAGHSRYKALKKLGYDKIQVNVVDLPEKEIKELRLLDNKIAESNEWDYSTLAIEMREVSNDIIVEAFGIEIDSDFVKSSATSVSVTAEDLAKKQEELNDFAVSKQSDASKKQEVICPHCFETYYIETR